MSRKKWTPYAECDGVAYVDVRCIMSPLCAMISLPRITTFAGSSRMYMPLEEAIVWVEKEIPHTTGKEKDKYTRVLEALKKARQDAADGNVTRQE